MTRYVLFLYGSFIDDEEVEFFCTEIFTDVKFHNIRFLVENIRNLIILFDSNMEKKELSEKLYELLASKSEKLNSPQKLVKRRLL